MNDSLRYGKVKFSFLTETKKIDEGFPCIAPPLTRQANAGKPESQIFVWEVLNGYISSKSEAKR